MKRTVATLTLALSLFMPATAALAGGNGGTKGNGPRYDCTAIGGGSLYAGLKPGEAKKLERSGFYVCVRVN